MNTSEKEHAEAPRGLIPASHQTPGFSLPKEASARFILLIVVVCIMLAGGFAIASGFNSDDFVELSAVGKPYWQCIRDYLTSPDAYSGGYFRPAPRILLRTLAEVVGLRAPVFHAVSLLLYLVTFFLLYRLIMRLGASGQVAFWGVVAFAVHPTHLETVIWISGMGGLAMAVCYLAALYEYDRYLAQPRLKWALLTLIFFTGALLFKEEAVTFPVAGLLLWIYRSDRRWRSTRPLIWIIAVMTCWVFWRTAVGAGAGPALAILSGNPLTWVRNALFYLVQFFVPVRSIVRLWDFNLYAQLRSIFPPTPGTLAFGLGVIVGAVAAAVVIVRNWLRWPVVVRAGLIFALVSLLLFLFYPQSGNRFLFLPSAGLAAAFAGWTAETPGKSARRILLLVWIGVMSVSTVEQASTWYQAGKITQHVLDDAERIRCSVPRDQATVFSDLPIRHFGAYVFSNGFRDALVLRTKFEYDRIYVYDQPTRNPGPIPPEALWFRWDVDRFVPTAAIPDSAGPP